MIRSVTLHLMFIKPFFSDPFLAQTAIGTNDRSAGSAGIEISHGGFARTIFQLAEASSGEPEPIRGHGDASRRLSQNSVVGTVFLVNAEEEGSRIAVIEGEVRVQPGTSEKSLRRGEAGRDRSIDVLL